MDLCQHAGKEEPNAGAVTQVLRNEFHAAPHSFISDPGSVEGLLDFRGQTLQNFIRRSHGPKSSIGWAASEG